MEGKQKILLVEATTKICISKETALQLFQPQKACPPNPHISVLLAHSLMPMISIWPIGKISQNMHFHHSQFLMVALSLSLTGCCDRSNCFLGSHNYCIVTLHPILNTCNATALLGNATVLTPPDPSFHLLCSKVWGLSPNISPQHCWIVGYF